jgi:hypothetical protein
MDRKLQRKITDHLRPAKSRKAGHYASTFKLCMNPKNFLDLRRVHALDYEVPDVYDADFDDLKLNDTEGKVCLSLIDSTIIPTKSCVDKLLSEMDEEPSVTIHSHTYSNDDVRSLYRVHSLRELQREVKEEIRWFNTLASTPKETPQIDQSEINSFKEMIFDSKDSEFTGHNDFQDISIHDLTNLVCNRWIRSGFILASMQIINQTTKSSCIIC